jgi:hypothetical protein
MITMDYSRRKVMLFMLVMTGLILLVLFGSGNIGYAAGTRSSIPASIFQAAIAIITIFSLFVIFSISIHPPKDIDAEIKEDKVNQRVEIKYVNKFIKKARNEGYADEQIKQGLMRHNWDEKSIDECLAEVKA